MFTAASPRELGTARRRLQEAIAVWERLEVEMEIAAQEIYDARRVLQEIEARLGLPLTRD